MLQPDVASSQSNVVYSPQEKRLALREGNGQEDAKTRESRDRIRAMIDGFRDQPIALSLDRARLLTASLKETEGQPMVLRWGKAVTAVLENLPIQIRDDEIIAGSADPAGRYGLFYPEVEGRFFANMSWLCPSQGESGLIVTEEDVAVVKEELAPYWKDNGYHDAYLEALPERARRLVKDGYWMIVPTATARSGLAWCHDYEKVLKRGIKGLKDEALTRLQLLEETAEDAEKRAFLEAVILVADAIVTFAHRYADLAQELAEQTDEQERKKELREIAKTCRWVPENPARTFREAIQSQWLIQVVSRLEQRIGGGVGNGRIDQYLYPYYKADIENGRINDEEVLELLESLWVGMGRSVELYAMAGVMFFINGYAHWEATTIGGQTPDGDDATNELSYLMLKSKEDVPISYPDLAARIHSRTPERFLYAVCETIKDGTGFPKLLFDEEIIPLLLAKGADVKEANDYCVAGCTEVKMVNRDALTTGCAWVNMGAMVEMALNDGWLGSVKHEQLGASTGDAKQFGSYKEVWEAFCRQAEFVMKHTFIQQQVADTLKPKFIASPMSSMLHDLCMKECMDMHDGPIDNALYLGSVDTLGFATAIDSLAAIKRLVFEEKKVSMTQLIDALASDFKGNEPLRQMCLHAPKYGNNDPYADSIGRDIEKFFTDLASQHTTAFGGQLDIRYVSVTSHVPLGSVVGATPDGRNAQQPLSEGISPSQGADTNGPTASMASVAATRCGGSKVRAARLLNMKFSPMTVAGREGTRRLMQFIRTACDLKTWHIQFNIINRETLLAAQKNPERYRDLLVRVAGYSAYFVDLLPDLQNEIIKRTEHCF